MKRLNILSFKNRKGPYGAASRSQAMLEFALALPILLMLLFGIIDLAALFQAWLTIENIARQTVRYAVTGQYDPAYCVDTMDGGTIDPSDACSGDARAEEQDAARLRSVQDYADRQTIALFRTPGAAQNEIGHLNVTICSNRDADPEDDVPDFTFIEPNPSIYADCQNSSGTSTSDAGGPGDRVIIAVDFNHPYITPFLNQIWPMTHLYSHREGIVEEFRVPRLVALADDPSSDTLTPSKTSEPTSTGTAVNTATATNTPLPLYIEIINPDPSGMLVTSVDQTRFEAIAWDPNIGTSNGTGISEIRFWFDGPGSIPGRTDHQAGYCAFGGNAPCSRIDAVMNYTTLPNGTYTMYARAESNDGRLSETVSKDFILQFPPTPTPTITHTPTATPIPSCNDVFITNEQVRDLSNDTSDFQVTVRNNNMASGYLVESRMTWDSPFSPPLYFDYFWFLNRDNQNRYYDPNPKNWYDSSHPTISWSDTAGAPAPLVGDAKTIWGAKFIRDGEPALSGTFNVRLTFYFPDLGNCAVSTTLFQPLPSPTPIPPTPTPFTPTPTPVCNLSGSVFTTDFYGDPQNVNGYDCAYGCIHSPYLSSNNLPSGSYYWTVHTVSSGNVQVNDGTFTLQPGQQAGPPSGVIVPLGLNMYNVPPNYFPGEFKVTVFQSTAQGCNSKTDNFKIQSHFPSPTPTKTSGPATPTYTERPTSTARPATETPTPSPSPTICLDC
ncbi:MAG: TadE/TadG family type IV pilus assembly protein [Anaerolineales bacterium]